MTLKSFAAQFFGSLAAMTWLLASPASAGSVGYTQTSVPDGTDTPLQVGIWYPTTSHPSTQPIGLFQQVVASNGAVDGAGHPLVVVSHGTGGSLEEHDDTDLALAAAGFIVAAVEHTGDNYRDQSRATDLGARPRAVHRVIDFMLTGWPGHAAIDPAKIGMFGFSAGGFTALVAIGGVPDLSRVQPYCADHVEAFVCQVVKDHPPTGSAPVWIADPRIKAAVIAAPAIGFTFSPGGLANVHIPVQLWRAGADHILPSPDYAEPVRDALPTPPEYHVAAGADHFDFLAPCSASLAAVVPQICQEPDGFDRTAFHVLFNQEVVRFFKTKL
jgi:predicted dienelactone hydrolase